MADSEDAKKQAIAKMEAAREEQAKAEESESSEVAMPKEEGHAEKTEIVASSDDKVKTLHRDEADKKPLDYTELKNVKVYSPFKVYYDGAAYSVSAVNGTGPFDVLPGHKNFLSLLKPCTIIIRTKRGQEEMKVDRGVMHVKDSEVIVFLDV